MKKDFPALPNIAGVSPVPRRVPAGEALFRRGDATFGIFFLSAGRMNMQRVTPDGGRVVMHVARPGETFAEASLFVERYQCDVVAEIDSEVWCYPKDALGARLRGNPDSLWEFAARLARDLHGLRQRYELKQIRSAPQRLLQLLRLNCAADGTYRPQGTLKELAAELGLTHEALYRGLASLEQSGAIERAGDEIRLAATPSRNKSAG